MRAVVKQGLVLMVMGLVIGKSRALAGPSYDLDTKALYAQAIIEAEIVVVPKSAGWKAANLRAKDRTIVRALFRAPEYESPAKTPPYFPFSTSSRCWARIEKEKKIRVLAFYPDETVFGLEEDGGAYSSLNSDYDRLVEAIATVSEWRRAPRREATTRKHLAAVSETSNPYLRFIGAHFLKEFDRSSDPKVDAIIKATLPAVIYPVADCDRLGKRANPGVEPDGPSARGLTPRR
jgi:hypothetical protein